MKATWVSPVIKVLLQIACTADFRCVTFPEHWKNECVCCCVWLCETPWTVAHKAPLFMELSRQEYWSELPVPTLGLLPTQGLNPCLLCLLHLESEFFTTNANWEALSRALLVFKHANSVFQLCNIFLLYEVFIPRYHDFTAKSGHFCCEYIVCWWNFFFHHKLTQLSNFSILTTTSIILS